MPLQRQVLLTAQHAVLGLLAEQARLRSIVQVDHVLNCQILQAKQPVDHLN